MCLAIGCAAAVAAAQNDPANQFPPLPFPVHLQPPLPAAPAQQAAPKTARFAEDAHLQHEAEFDPHVAISSTGLAGKGPGSDGLPGGSPPATCSRGMKGILKHPPPPPPPPPAGTLG